MSSLQFRANPKQKEALTYLYDNVTESVGYGGGGGGGKSFIGVFWIWSMCITYPGVRYFFGRNELKRLKATTLISYFKFLSEYNIPKEQRGNYSEQHSKITFQNTSEILLLDLAYKPSDPLVTSLGSLEVTGGFVDESPEVRSEVIDVLYSRVGRHLNDKYNILPKILESFNPDKGRVYRTFYKPWKDGVLPKHIAFIRALVTDWLQYPDYWSENYQVHPDEQNTWHGMYIRQLLNRSNITKQRLLFGNFEYDDDASALCTYDAITDAFTNSHVQPNGKRYLTADIALQGSDTFRVGVWDGFVLIHIESMAKSDGKQIIDTITRLKIQFNVPNSGITYDNDGVGGFIGGFLQGAKPFVNNGAAVKVQGDKENYFNLKSQCYYRLAKRINDRELWLKCIDQRSDPTLYEQTVEELEQIKGHDVDKDGKLRVIPKELVKSNIGRSPDISDMIMMREYLELTPKPRGLTLANR